MVLRILQFILILLVVRAVWRLLQGVAQGVSGQVGGARTPVSGVKLVRDPVCGTFVSPAQALTARAAGETVYFCSEKCRREWERVER